MRTIRLSDAETLAVVWAVDHAVLDTLDYLEGTGPYADLPCEAAKEIETLRRALRVLAKVRRRLHPSPQLARLG